MIRALLPLFLALTCLSQTTPHPYPDQTENDYVARDFTFKSGETLPELRLHYTTLGKPVRDASGHVTNAVLIMHGTGGTGRAFLSAGFGGELFEPGQPLDAARYFIILPDAIGHGKSGRPGDGLHARFPHYRYDDMVRADYLLIHDALMPLASAPVQIAGRNRMFRAMIIDAIREDPAWKGGEYAAPPEQGLIAAQYALWMMTSSPLQLHKTNPTYEKADSAVQALRKRAFQTDANDMLYQFEASTDYNPSPLLEKIKAPLFAVNSADDEVNPPELGILEREIKRVARGRYILIPTSDETRGHGTHSRAVVWKSYLSELLRESSPR